MTLIWGNIGFMGRLISLLTFPYAIGLAPFASLVIRIRQAQRAQLQVLAFGLGDSVRLRQYPRFLL